MISCSMSGRTFLFTIFLVMVNALILFGISITGSITLSMTYSIKVKPYNDPYITIVEEAGEALAETLIPGAFLVDVFPIMKYIPEWFPGARFQRKAAVMRKQAAMMRNTTFAATEKLIVCNFITFSPILTYFNAYIFRPTVTMIPRSSQKH